MKAAGIDWFNIFLILMIGFLFVDIYLKQNRYKSDILCTLAGYPFKWIMIMFVALGAFTLGILAFNVYTGGIAWDKILRNSFWILFSLYWIYIGTRKYQITSKGILIISYMYRWEDIDTWQISGNTLILKLNSQVMSTKYRSNVQCNLIDSQKEEIKNLLSKYIPLKT